MNKRTIKSIFINEKKQDGTAFVDKNGNPYKMANLKFEGDDLQYSMFIGEKFGAKDLEVISQWKSGDDVEVITLQNGQYWNFKLPSKTDLLEIRVDKMSEWATDVDKRLEALEVPTINVEDN